MSNIKAQKKVVFNSLTGEFDLVTDNNYSYESVPAGKKLKIVTNMQMIVHGTFTAAGTLIVDGRLIIL